MILLLILMAFFLSAMVQVQSLGVVLAIKSYLQNESVLIQFPFNSKSWEWADPLAALLAITLAHGVASLSYYAIREVLVALVIRSSWLIHLFSRLGEVRLVSLTDQEIIAAGGRAWITNTVYMPLRIGMYLLFSCTISPWFTLLLALSALATRVPLLLLRQRLTSMHQRTLKAQESLSEEFGVWHRAKSELVRQGLVPWQRRRMVGLVDGVVFWQVAEGIGANGMRLFSTLGFYFLLVGAAYLAKNVFILEYDQVAFLILSLSRLKETLVSYSDNAVKINEGRVRLSQWASNLRREDLSQVMSTFQKRSPEIGSSGIELSGIQLSLPGEVDLFTGLTLELLPANLYLIEGPSGSGKTTLLQLLIGERLAERGRVLSSGEFPLVESNGMVYLRASLRQNLLLPEDPNGLKESLEYLEEIKAQWLYDILISRFSLDLPIMSHSVGQGRLIALLRGLLLARNGQGILVDEPFAHLDMGLHRRIAEIFVELVHRGGLVVITLHHQEQWPLAQREELQPWRELVKGASGFTLYCAEAMEINVRATLEM
jgi:ABC-type transport system involved in cytochrome c biogenesis ATPase subunit